MSGTANEYDEPGGNYPDRNDSSPVEPAQDRGRDDGATVQHGETPSTVQGGAVAPDAQAPGSSGGTGDGRNTQDAPAMDMHGTTTEDRITGIVAQTRSDVGDAPPERIADVLRQRFADTGIDVGDDRVRALAAEIADR